MRTSSESADAPRPGHAGSVNRARPDLITAPRVAEIAQHVRAILQLLDIDLADPNLEGTPGRVARTYAALFTGNHVRSEPPLKTFPNREAYTRIISVRDIPFFSMCAHHLLPFFGSAHIGYVPGERLVGLSKLARVVDFYARRPQLQENLTEHIVGYLERELQPQGVMVILQARHLCMEMRGVHKPGALTSTSAIRGCFEDRAVRDEFLQLLQRAPTGA